MNKNAWLIVGIVGLLLIPTGIIFGVVNTVDEGAFCEERVKQYWPEYDVVKSVSYYGDECTVNIIKGQTQRDGLILQESVETKVFSLTGDAKEYVHKDDDTNGWAVGLFIIGILATMIGFDAAEYSRD